MRGACLLYVCTHVYTHVYTHVHAHDRTQVKGFLPEEEEDTDLLSTDRRLAKSKRVCALAVRTHVYRFAYRS